MLDDGAIGRGDPSVRHHFRDSVSDTMRITDLAAPRKIPREPVGGNSSIPFHFTKLIQVNRPGNGTTAIYRDVSVGISVGNMSSRLCPARAAWGHHDGRVHRRRVSGMPAGERDCDRRGSEFRYPGRPHRRVAAGDYAAIINDTDVQGYADIREHLGQNTVGLDVLAGNRTSDQPRPLVPAMFSAVLSRLRRTHTVIVIDTSPDLEHDVMKAVLQSTDTLVFVSGITADRSRPVLRAVDYLRAQGYHELVSRSTVILNHTDSITDKDALAYLTERFTKVGAIVEAMPFDPHLAKGGIIDTVHELNKKSRLRLFEITAGLADKYVPDAERAAQ